MQKLKSWLFLIFINLWGAIIPVLYSPVFIIRSRKIADHGAYVWSKVSLAVLKKLCGVECEVRGLEKIDLSKSYIIACKHQSMWETIVMHLIFKHPVYAFKKELLHIPFYGWYLRIMSGIIVDRQGGASALKNLIKQSKIYLANKQNIILFPQGTRVPVNGEVKDFPYQPGVAALYLNCDVEVIPVALNSGVYWPKKGGVQKPGKIVIEFMEPIKKGLKRDEFMKILQEKVESKSLELCQR